MLNFYLLIIFILISCSSIEEQRHNKEELNQFYISNGVEQYFLADLPHWINFSPLGQCQRAQSVRYLNFETINQSFNLDYEKMVHLQHMWNKKINSYKLEEKKSEVSLKEEAFIFNNMYAKALGGSYDFIVPNYPKVSLIIIDDYLSRPKALKKVLNRSDVQRGFPVLVSNCLLSYEIEELISKNDIEEFGVKYISAEMFSVYNSSVKSSFQFSLDVSKILTGKKIILFSKNKETNIFGFEKKVELK